MNFDYRLAPEQLHPAAVDDSTAAYRALLEMDIKREHIAISGDSAGGGLTLSALLKLRDDGVPLPAVGIPLSPWSDLEGVGESMDSNSAADLLIGRDGLKRMVDMFLDGQDARDPLAAPLYADYTGVPPLYIQVGGAETLLDDSTRVAAAAERAGCEVRLDVFPEMQHVFQMSAGNLPEANDAIARIGERLRPRLGLTRVSGDSASLAELQRSTSLEGPYRLDEVLAHSSSEASSLRTSLSWSIVTVASNSMSRRSAQPGLRMPAACWPRGSCIAKPWPTRYAGNTSYERALGTSSSSPSIMQCHDRAGVRRVAGARLRDSVRALCLGLDTDAHACDISNGKF